jgi:hypothetical protein
MKFPHIINVGYFKNKTKQGNGSSHVILANWEAEIEKITAH